MGVPNDFDALLVEGLAVNVSAYWGAGFLDGRCVADRPTWDWTSLVRRQPTARRAYSTWAPVRAACSPRSSRCRRSRWRTRMGADRPAAISTLGPLGVHVVSCLGADDNPAPQRRARPGLPFADDSFDLILNRHESFDANELARVAADDGTFLTQQVGNRESASVRELLGLPPAAAAWTRDLAVGDPVAGGWCVTASAEAYPTVRFRDIAALIGYVRSTPWSFPDLAADSERGWTDPPVGAALRAAHEACVRECEVAATGHRFWVKAVRVEVPG